MLVDTRYAMPWIAAFSAAPRGHTPGRGTSHPAVPLGGRTAAPSVAGRGVAGEVAPFRVLWVF